MNVNEYALKMDRTAENSVIAASYLYQILNEVNERGQVTAFDLYIECGFSDIPMYLALHTLCKTGLIDGKSPYEVDEDGDVFATQMTQMVYTSKEYVRPRDIVPAGLL